MEVEKLDLRGKLKIYYSPSARAVELVNVPALNFAMIEGKIETGATPSSSPEFQNALQMLYGISFTLKYMSKQLKQNPIDYSVMALEALWWVDQGEFDITQPGNWNWIAMILQPDHITPELFAEGIHQLQKKRGNADLSKLRLERFQEGLCVQIMHIGPYAAEAQTISRMHAFARENGYRFRGQHHEIYLGDPRRSSPEKLKTILRQPVG